jgi:hypothetical protein
MNSITGKPLAGCSLPFAVASLFGGGEDAVRVHGASLFP